MMDTVVTDLVVLIFVKATVVIGVAWLAASLLSFLSAAKRHAVWGLALAFLLFMPLTSPFAPTWHVGVIPQLAAPAGTQGTALSAVSPAARQATARPVEVSAKKPATGGAAAPGPAASESRSQARSAAGWGEQISWTAVAFWIWTLGAVVVLVQLALGLAWVIDRRKQAIPLLDPARLEMIAKLSEEAELQRSVEVVYGPEGEVQTPMVWGLARSTILLPAEACSWPEERFRAVLLHELAHVKRWDYPVHLLAQCAQAFFWPNPLTWLAARRLHREQEQACDDMVLQSGVASHEYAEHLLGIVRSLRDKKVHHMGGAVAMGRQSSIKDRMQALLNDHIDRSPLGLRMGIVMSVAGGLLSLPVMGLSLERASTEQGERSLEYVWMEAEDGVIPQAMEKRGASGAARYVEVVKEDHMETPPDARSSTYRFEVQQAGRYVIWGRVFSENDGQNSFWIRVDEGRWVRWNNIGEIGAWAWDEVHDSDRREEVVGFQLAEGEHTLEVAHRESGARLDQMLVTSNWNYQPRGESPAPAREEAERIWLEAEDGWLQAPITTQNDRFAAGWRYVESDDASSRDDVPSGGRALYDFEVASTGTYHVWGRLLAKSDENDSFWIRMDEGEWIKWNDLEKRPTWSWQNVHDSDEEGRNVSFDLAEGRHTLEVAYREEDAKLDKLLITDDASYLPRRQGRAVGEVPYQRRLEPEEGRLQPPMQVGRDTLASGGSYIAVADGEDNDAPEGGPGYAELAFTVDEAGEYVIYGRVRAPNGNDNSFYVSIDGGEEFAWHAPGPGSEGTADEWTWDLVSSGEGDDIVDPQVFSLGWGEHVLRIRNREDGSQLDELIIANEQGARTQARISVTGL